MRPDLPKTDPRARALPGEEGRTTAEPQSQCLHELFEAQVEKTPDAIALIYEDQRLTYRELNDRSNQLAHYLCRSGVKTEALVAICLERSVEMVVGLLGILKSGAAYVPVDPAYPPERLNFMLEDCRSQVILTQQRLLKSLPSIDASVICLDASWNEIEKEARHNPAIQLTSDNLSYVIYTSGSTGKPKGAMNTHGAICNRLIWMQDAYRLDSTDRILQKTPFSFDVSVWEFFWPLMTGARLVVARPFGHLDNTYLVNLIAQEQITTLHFVPSMLQVFLEEPDLRKKCVSLRRVICSGEALSYDLQNRFFKLSDADLHNLYGPTEAAVDVTFWQCLREGELRVVPIGYPIANAQIHLLDEQLQPVPAGVAGELHIGGICLARGYLHRAELTAERFIPSPLAAGPGERLYKTGDLARYLPNGAIEYLSRIDHQLKICGVRIEVGEIESAILEHLSVRETVVLAREDRPGDKRLIAYVVAENNIEPSHNELRSFLETRLPHYMVPSAFVWIEKLPLTPNGKVDRSRLPAPTSFEREKRQVTAPRTPIEELIAETWCEVMGLDVISVDDNFFELGGHSLLASLLVSRLRQSLTAELSVPDIFDSPTVAQLAARFETRLQAGQQKLTVGPIQSEEREKTCGLSHAQQRLWFLHRLKPASAFYNLPLVLHLQGSLNLEALDESFSEIVRRHEVLRTRFVEIDGVPMQVVENPAPQKIKLVESDSVREEEASRIVREAVRAPFDLTNDALWRALIVRLGAEEHVLVVVMHHIISDGWSMNVFVRELSLLYTAYVEGRESPLPELPIQYRDYVAWQREWPSSAVEEEQLSYWKKQLEGSAPVLNLPSDRPRPSVETYEGKTYHTTLPAPLVEALRSLGRQASSTLYMTLLAAFNVLLYRYTGQTDINVGTPLAGRNSSDAEKLIGFFVNTVVIRTKLAGSQSFRDLLEHTRQTSLAAYINQDIQFERIVEELQIERSLSHAPVFQVVLAFNNAADLKLELPNLESTLLEIDTTTSKFDLALLIDDLGTELKMGVEYSTALFDPATIERLARHFETLLESIVSDPDQRISNLKLLTDSESSQILSQWNDTRKEFPQNACIHELFERQVELTPDAVAVVSNDERLTYAELNRRANQLAHHLQSLGVGPETLVGIRFKRSVDMLVATVATVKAGGAYVPLDPAYPKERLAFMLEDTGAQVLLTEQRLLESLPPCEARVFCLDAERETLGAESDRNPTSSARPDNLAYVIFTSGSTGKPKGVEVSHAGLVNLVCWHQRMYEVDAGSRVSQVAGPSFDAAVWEVWANLTAGVCMYLPDEETALSGPKLWQWLQDQNITHCFLPTPLVEIVLPLAEAALSASGSPTPLRYLFTGGDKLHQRPSRELPFRLVNLYGPTEATVVATAATIESRLHNNGAPSIGEPIDNTQVYILDSQLQPVPLGVPGELYIGGVGLARGYLKHPELTADRFIPNPYAVSNGERMYRTGDMARYLWNGNIDCLGRIDEQVKIRGFRIELGEIETVLSQHEGVREAVVVAHPDSHGGNRLIAYFVQNTEQPTTIAELRHYLKNVLPEYMIPATFVTLEALPLTPNGKVDRRRLPEPDSIRPELEEHYVSPRSELERTIAGIWKEVLQVDTVGVDDNFFSLGGHSLLIVQVNSRLREVLQAELSIIEMFKYPTIRSLAEYLGQEMSAMSTSQLKKPAQIRLEAADRQKQLRHQRQPARTAKENQLADHKAMEVAIIGMAGRFPGAKNLAEFWQNLINGVESITFFTPEELQLENIDAAFNDPNYVPAKAVLEDVEMFDAVFFGYNPREAEMLDPQHRLLLECAVEALEHGGYDPERIQGRIGVYTGVSAGTYLTANLSSHPDLIDRVGAYQVDIGNRGEFVPTTISFKLNLKGPSLNIQTACSTSLVAVHTACQSLLNGECDMALAGGGSITFPHKEGYFYQEEGIMSPDGHCRAFDENGRGTVAGEGVGLVVLKRLVDAVADGDTIHAVIKGSAINNDGSLKVGFTAPSIDGQAQVISEALAVAGVDADSISYVETHGTGTILGDPIEIAALTQAYRLTTQKQGFCAIGSLKTNIGHLDAGAGVAGLIKTTLALTHKEIPPSLHYKTPNPKIDFETSPFSVNAQLTEWKTQAGPRRAGVSSFGIGGTNAHVILEEAPPALLSTENSTPHLLILSAKTSSALETTTDQFVRHLMDHPEVSVDDVAFTLQVGRREFAHRRMLVCRDANDAIAALTSRDSKRVLTGFEEPRHRPCVFMFPGQGTQYAGMSKELYETDRFFREQIDICAELLFLHLKLDLREVIYPTAERLEEASQLLSQTFITQPTLFMLEYAMARLWMSRGVDPAAMIGHSLGEYVAACLAGVFSLEDALALVAARGRLIQQLPAGLMLAVPLPEEEVKELLPLELSLAVINSPKSCVVSGPTEIINDFQSALSRREIHSQLLQTSHAFHSAMMEPILPEFTAHIRQLNLGVPSIPFISNLTGTWITTAEATDPSYWARHLRQPVRFASGIGELLREPDRILLEVGPGHTLRTYARQHPQKSSNQVILNSLPGSNKRQSETQVFLTALGKLWLAGGRVDWSRFNAGKQRRRVPLPGYPFERKRYYVEPRGRSLGARTNGKLHKTPAENWIYLPSWKRVALPGTQKDRSLQESKSVWLLFVDDCGLGFELAGRLTQAGEEVISVTAGDRFIKVKEGHYTINSRQAEDYQSLLADLSAERVTLKRVVHLWSVTASEEASPLENEFARAQELGLYSLIFLTQALAKNFKDVSLQLLVVTNHVQEVSGDEVLQPEKATVLSACRVIPQEHPGITCRSIDVSMVSARHRERLLAHLLNELMVDSSDQVTAYRGRHRWVQTFEPVADQSTQNGHLRERGVYLITGGLSDVGFGVARFLAHNVRARLVLIDLPEHKAMPAAKKPDGIRRVEELETMGAEVLVQRADLSDEQQMREALALIENQFGGLNGVIHTGVAVNGAIVHKKIVEMAPSDFEAHFQAKAHGLRMLEKILHGRKLDFCLVFSSISSVLGGLNLTAHAASNIFVDVLVQNHNRNNGSNWMSVNWDSTLQRETGEVFSRTLSMLPASQVVVSTGDLESQIIDSESLSSVIEQDKEVSELRDQTKPSPGYAAPESERERMLVQIWEDLLGIKQIGIDDDFFDLDGHSLLGTMMISRIRKSFGVDLQLRDIFQAPTVRGLSLTIEQRLGSQDKSREAKTLISPSSMRARR